MFLCPLDPALEVIYSHFVTVNHLALEVSVDLMEIESVVTWDEALSLEYVSAEFVDVACCTREVSCHCDASVQ